MNYRVGILLVSPQLTGSSLYENGLPLASMLERAGYQVAGMETVLPDLKSLEEKLTAWAERLDLIVTMGGVSLKPEDVVPEATQAVCQRMIPGMGEAMRSHCYEITPRAMLSRGTAGIRGKTLILNLPGRSQPAMENLEPVLPALSHALEMLHT